VKIFLGLDIFAKTKSSVFGNTLYRFVANFVEGDDNLAFLQKLKRFLVFNSVFSDYDVRYHVILNYIWPR
jgi:hypothetical protein